MKNIKLKEFSYSENDLKNAAINSLLCDSGQIAELKFAINGKDENIELRVCGEKRILFKDDIYRYSSEYPEELTALIKEGKIYSLEYDTIGNNNWIELMYTENGEYDDCEGDVVDGRFGNGTPEEALEYLINMIKEIYAPDDNIKITGRESIECYNSDIYKFESI